MKHSLSSLVAVLCLLAFFVSSAACFAAPLPQQANEIHMHSMSASGHACCPNHSPADTQVSNACCTVHHQPASATSASESQQPGLPSLIASALPLLNRLTAHALANVRIAPQQHPPLIALRI
jgi:hypothetical protein